MVIYDYLIVGAGLFGATFADLATTSGKKCLVIDKNSYIAGNCATTKIENIIVHQAGPHIFHCSNLAIWNYVNKLTPFRQFMLRPKTHVDGNIYSLPLNLGTLNQVFGVKTPEDAKRLIEKVKISNNNPQNLEEWILSQVGHDLYEMFIKGYTKKQWGKDPKELPVGIIKRLPIRFNWDDNYFNDEYQGIPIEGYSKLIEKMLLNSDVLLNTDFFKEKNILQKICKKTVYTGKIDEFFDYSLGELEYRGLTIKTTVLDIEDHQGVVMMNHPGSDVTFTRVTEHKHFDPFFKSDKTVLTWEYPKQALRDDTPYYPIPDDKNSQLYKKYAELAKQLSNVLFGGRLASYKYRNMDQIIGEASHLAKKEGLYSI